MMDSTGIDNNKYAHIMYIQSDGRINHIYPNRSYNLQLVLNLKSDITVTGSGTSSYPFVVQ